MPSAAVPEVEIDGTSQLDKNCKTCDGIGLVSNVYPEPTYLSNNPQNVCTNFLGQKTSPQTSYCCNQPRNALLRVRPASTNLKKNYYTTLQQYRQNRCQTYDQKIFNFYSPAIATTLSKEGADVESLANLYVGNCYPNTGNNQSQVELVTAAYQYSLTQGYISIADQIKFNSLNITTLAEYINYLSTLSPESNGAQATTIFNNYISNPYIGMGFSGPSNPNGCKLVIYKPSNPQFAVEGGVSSSTRTLKLAVDTAEKAVYNQNLLSGSASYIPNVNGQPFVPFIYKNKTPKCQRNPYYPRIYNTGEFPVGDETYFVYEQEYLNYVSDEEEVLEYIEDLMRAVPRGEQALQAFYQNKPRPQSLAPEEVAGLVKATHDLERSIGGPGSLDLSMIENIRRRKDGHLVIMDPYSL
jgi:hypothetical protein